MAATTYCAACGSTKGLAEHHLLPRALGGKNGPTVILCGTCHSLVHETNLVNMQRLSAIKVAERRTDGKRIGQYVPFGFALGGDGERLVVDSATSEWVQHCFRWYAEGAGSTTIARRLCAAGVQTVTGRNWKAKGVLYLLGNDVYLLHEVIDDDLFRAVGRRRERARKRYVGKWREQSTLEV